MEKLASLPVAPLSVDEMIEINGGEGESFPLWDWIKQMSPIGDCTPPPPPA